MQNENLDHLGLKLNNDNQNNISSNNKSNEGRKESKNLFNFYN